MTANKDSRPFVELQQSGHDFLTGFEKDIKMCLNILESKLSTLIRDPDSLESTSKEGRRLSAHMEFSKAKMDIFMSMKSIAERKVADWEEQIDTMITTFLENVEILLASTHLDRNAQQGEKKSGSKSSRISSITPYSLLNTAKRIPVLNSFLSNDEEDVPKSYSPRVSLSDAQKKKAGLKQNSSPKLDKTTARIPLQSDISYNNNNKDYDDYESSENEEPIQELRTPIKSSEIPTKRINARTSPAVKEVAAKSLRKKIIEVSEDVPRATRRTAVTKRSVSEEPAKTTQPKKNAGKGRKSILKSDPSNDIELHATPSRSTRKRTAVKGSSQAGETEETEMNDSDQEVSSGPKTPKNVHFSIGFDIEDDLEIYSPEVNLTRSAPRRKTVMISDIPECSNDFNLTPNIVRSKRKTFASGGEMNVSVAPSPKRLKRGRSSVAPMPIMEVEEEDHLDSEESSNAERYTPWQLLDDLDGKVPAQAGIYELKVYKAKKSAYIGSCDNLRQKLTLHKLGQSSGHKHLDKFLERNKKDVQVRYEKMPSASQAKNEEMNRIKAFVSQHKTTPAYN